MKGEIDKKKKKLNLGENGLTQKIKPQKTIKSDHKNLKKTTRIKRETYQWKVLSINYLAWHQ